MVSSFKLLGAILTYERPLTRVASLMASQDILSCECLLTYCACVRSLTRMGHPMVRQVRLPAVDFGTLGEVTFMGFLSPLNPQSVSPGSRTQRTQTNTGIVNVPWQEIVSHHGRDVPHGDLSWVIHSIV